MEWTTDWLIEWIYEWLIDWLNEWINVWIKLFYGFKGNFLLGRFVHWHLLTNIFGLGSTFRYSSVRHCPVNMHCYQGYNDIVDLAMLSWFD